MGSPFEQNRHYRPPRPPPYPSFHGFQAHHYHHPPSSGSHPFAYPECHPSPGFEPSSWHRNLASLPPQIDAFPYIHRPAQDTSVRGLGNESVSPFQVQGFVPGSSGSSQGRQSARSRLGSFHPAGIEEKKKKKSRKRGQRNESFGSSGSRAEVSGRYYNEVRVNQREAEPKHHIATSLNGSSQATLGRSRGDGVLDYGSGNSNFGKSFLGQQATAQVEIRSGWERNLGEEDKRSTCSWKGSVVEDRSLSKRMPTTHAQTTRIDVNALGQRVSVTITKEASEIQAWIGRQCVSELFGFDLEWRPNFESGCNNKVALLQVCGEKECLNIQMLFLDRKPNALGQFLLDPRKSLAGVNIRADTKKLEEDHALACDSIIELTTLAAQKLNREDLKQAGLKKLVQEVLGLNMLKPKKNHHEQLGQANFGPSTGGVCLY